MKIQIDTVAKTIKVESDVKLKELITSLKTMFPNKEWEDFVLTTNTIIQNWSYPIYVEKLVPDKSYWENPWYCESENIAISKATPINEMYKLAEGIFNIEC